MKFYSTNNNMEKVSFKEALTEGMPLDNGLYMPEFIPDHSKLIKGMSSLDINSYKDSKFFDGNNLTLAYQFIEEDRITRKYQSDDYNNTYIDAHVTSLNWDFTLGKLVYGLELTNKRKAYYQTDYIDSIKYYKTRIHIIYWIVALIYFGVFVKNQMYKSKIQIGILIAIVMYPFVINSIMLKLIALLKYIFKLTPANVYRNLYSQDINKSSDKDDGIYVHYSRVRNSGGIDNNNVFGESSSLGSSEVSVGGGSGGGGIGGGSSSIRDIPTSAILAFKNDHQKVTGSCTDANEQPAGGDYCESGATGTPDHYTGLKVTTENSKNLLESTSPTTIPNIYRINVTPDNKWTATKNNFFVKWNIKDTPLTRLQTGQDLYVLLVKDLTQQVEITPIGMNQNLFSFDNPVIPTTGIIFDSSTDFANIKTDISLNRNGQIKLSGTNQHDVDFVKYDATTETIQALQAGYIEHPVPGRATYRVNSDLDQFFGQGIEEVQLDSNDTIIWETDGTLDAPILGGLILIKRGVNYIGFYNYQKTISSGFTNESFANEEPIITFKEKPIFISQQVPKFVKKK